MASPASAKSCQSLIDRRDGPIGEQAGGKTGWADDFFVRYKPMKNKKISKLLLSMAIILATFVFLKGRTASKLDQLIHQLKTGKFNYTREAAGIIMDSRLFPEHHHLSIGPINECRKAAVKEKLLIYPFSSNGGSCNARENALSCLYDMKEEIKQNPEVISALKKVILLNEADHSGESVCRQRSMAIILLNEVGNAPEKEFIANFLQKQNNESKCESLECNAANFVLSKEAQ